MRRPGAPRKPRTGLLRIRPWILPAVAVALGVQLFLGGFDLGDVRDHLRAGRPEQALALLGEARPGDLVAALTTYGGFDWFPAARRATDLAALREMGPDERYESPEHPTLVAPLEAFRQPPGEVRLREALERDATVVLKNIEMGLDAGRVDLPAGTRAAPIGATLLRGSSFAMHLVDARSELSLEALAAFEIVPPQRAHAVELELATVAQRIAVDDPSTALLQAVVLLNRGLCDEALGRLDELLDEPAYGALARELAALCLVRQGLDHSALRVLDGEARP